MAQFGEHGFDRATIRGIAAAAGVASSLVRHHFGSKRGLPEACDEHLVKAVQELNTEIKDSTAVARPGPVIGPTSDISHGR